MLLYHKLLILSLAVHRVNAQVQDQLTAHVVTWLGSATVNSLSRVDSVMSVSPGPAISMKTTHSAAVKVCVEYKHVNSKQYYICMFID